MREYGMNLGMAFQVVDDILDFTGDASLMGKPIGSDLMSGNITLPAILYMQKNPSNPIQHAFEGVRRTSNIKKAIKEILADDSIFWEAKNIAREMCDEARESIDDLPDSIEKKILLNLVEYTFSREH